MERRKPRNVRHVFIWVYKNLSICTPLFVSDFVHPCKKHVAKGTKRKRMYLLTGLYNTKWYQMLSASVLHSVAFFSTEITMYRSPDVFKVKKKNKIVLKKAHWEKLGFSRVPFWELQVGREGGEKRRYRCSHRINYHGIFFLLCWMLRFYPGCCTVEIFHIQCL